MSIKVNMQLTENTFGINAESFPRLFYTDFSGKTSMIKDIDIRYGENCIEMQTILTDRELVKRYLDNWINTEEVKLTKQLAEIQKKLEILKSVK